MYNFFAIFWEVSTWFGRGAFVGSLTFIQCMRPRYSEEVVMHSVTSTRSILEGISISYGPFSPMLHPFRAIRRIASALANHFCTSGYLLFMLASFGCKTLQIRFSRLYWNRHCGMVISRKFAMLVLLTMEKLARRRN